MWQIISIEMYTIKSTRRSKIYLSNTCGPKESEYRSQPFLTKISIFVLMPEQISNIWELGIVFALFQCFSHCLKKAFQTAKKTCAKSSINISPFLAVYCLHEQTSGNQFFHFSEEFDIPDTYTYVV